MRRDTKIIKYDYHALTNYIHVKDLKDIENTADKIFFMLFDNIYFSYYRKYDKERNDIIKSFRCKRWFYSCDEECKKNMKDVVS